MLVPVIVADSSNESRRPRNDLRLRIMLSVKVGQRVGEFPGRFRQATDDEQDGGEETEIT
ncbi:MAG: hypothetical protein ABI766_04770 [Gemmatimonadales bacterium]